MVWKKFASTEYWNTWKTGWKEVWGIWGWEDHQRKVDLLICLFISWNTTAQAQDKTRIFNVMFNTWKSPGRPHQWVCQWVGWCRARCRRGRPAQDPGNPPTETGRKGDWFSKGRYWIEVMRLVGFSPWLGRQHRTNKLYSHRLHNQTHCAIVYK